MRKYIKSSSSERNDFRYLISELKRRGIDTTKHRYILTAEEHGIGGGNIYRFKFVAPGNYIAYFSMSGNRSLSPEVVIWYADDYFDGVDGLLEEIPTVKAMADYASETWWGDGSDYIFSLENIDTGELLYEGDQMSSDIENDDDWD